MSGKLYDLGAFPGLLLGPFVGDAWEPGEPAPEIEMPPDHVPGFIVTTITSLELQQHLDVIEGVPDLFQRAFKLCILQHPTMDGMRFKYCNVYHYPRAVNLTEEARIESWRPELDSKEFM